MGDFGFRRPSQQAGAPQPRFSFSSAFRHSSANFAELIHASNAACACSGVVVLV